MPNPYAELAKMARGQVARRYIDSSMLNISVTGTVVHITGVLRPLRGYPVVLKDEMETISQILRSKAGITEVHWDVTIRS